MSELRYDPLSGHWVNIAAIRAQRPNEFRHRQSRRPEAICPFCRGQESQTPPAILELSARDASNHRAANFSTGPSDAWLVRVVPNKYPAFADGAQALRQPIGPYGRLHGGGVQEIIVESARHLTSASQLSDLELELSFYAFQLRLRAANRSPQIRQLTLFKNCRPEAGASIEHIHSQLVGSPILSDVLAARWDRCAAAYHKTGRSLLQSILDFELQEGCRLVESRGKFVAFCPYASRFAFQTWIAASAPIASFESLGREDLADLCRLVRSVVSRFEQTLEAPPYNWVVHLPPNDVVERSAQEMFPWFIEFIPRLSRWAGFELAEAGWINDCPPEFAAAKLRGD